MAGLCLAFQKSGPKSSISSLKRFFIKKRRLFSSRKVAFLFPQKLSYKYSKPTSKARQRANSFAHCLAEGGLRASEAPTSSWTRLVLIQHSPTKLLMVGYFFTCYRGVRLVTTENRYAVFVSFGSVMKISKLIFATLTSLPLG